MSRNVCSFAHLEKIVLGVPWAWYTKVYYKYSLEGIWWIFKFVGVFGEKTVSKIMGVYGGLSNLSGVYGEKIKILIITKWY